MITAPKFWDKAAPKYALSVIKDMDSYEATLAHTRTYLNQDQSVLEIGCGTGTTALKLAASVGRITASDFSQGMIDIARQKVQTQGIDNVDCIVAAPGDGTIKGPYDAVLAFNLLHLIQDLPDALNNVASMLPKDGLFISKTTCLGTWSPLKPLVWVMQAVGKAPFVHFLKTDDLEKMVIAAGFDIVESRSYPVGKRNWFIVARKR